MMTAILISEVEIIWMLIPPRPRQSNSRAATPECERIPMPTTLSLAMPSRELERRRADRVHHGPQRRFRRREVRPVEGERDVRRAVGRHVLHDHVDDDPRFRQRVEHRGRRAGRSGTPVIVTFAWFFSTLRPRMTTFSMLGVSSMIMVPGLSLN